MGTTELLISKLQRQLSYHEYIRTNKWWFTHIDRIQEDYSFLNIGANIIAEIGGEDVNCIVKDFILWDGILVETDYGNVYYYETKKL